MKKKLLLTLLVATVLSLPGFAVDFEYNGVIYTTLTGNTVTTKVGSSTVAGNTFTGDLVIPEKVYDGNSTEYTVTEIGNYSFMNLGITSVTLPETITKMGTYAFRGTDIEWIIIPASVTSLGTMSFGYNDNLEMVVIGGSPSSTAPFMECPNITKIYCLSTTPTSMSNWSSAVYTNATVYVPVGYLDTYKSNSSWSRFTYIVEGTEYVHPNDAPKLPSTITAKVGEQIDIAAALYETSAAQWTSSNEEVADITASGTLTARQYGRTVVNGLDADGRSIASADVFVMPSVKIVYPEGAIVEHLVPYMSRPQINITPLDGWKINSVVADDNDITAQIADNTFVPAQSVAENVTLNIVTESTANTAGYHLTINGRELSIADGGEISTVTVKYPTLDNTIYSANERNITLAQGGMYDVEVTAANGGTSTYRIAVQ